MNNYKVLGPELELDTVNVGTARVLSQEKAEKGGKSTSITDWTRHAASAWKHSNALRHVFVSHAITYFTTIVGMSTRRKRWPRTNC